MGNGPFLEVAQAQDNTSTPYVICDQNWDSSKMPECEKLCAPMYSSTTTTVKCVDKKGIEINCQEATEGSVLTYLCTPFYETPFGFRKTILCLDGSWNYPKPVCQPVCGRKVNDDAIPLIYGGRIQKGLEYPWVVALYKKDDDSYTNICGGSLISQRVVLTAAHCVTNEYGELPPIENYIVGAGKFYNNFNDSRDVQAQYSQISRAIVHDGYKGDRRRFFSDIALLVVAKSFRLTYLVQPICFNDVNNIHLHAGNIGVVSGWGVKEDGLPSEELRVLEIPYKYETTCAQELPREWADKYNAIDKICAGFLNKNMSVCRGDSGNGLAVKNPEDNRYYIHGIVSIGPSEKGECNIQQNSLYTKVAFYYEFIDKELSRYSVEDCILPLYPKHGLWITSETEKKPGENVPADTVIKLSCNEGFTLSSDVPDVQCKQTAFDMPTCQPICPALVFPLSTITNCKDRRGEIVSCSKATDDTILTYACPEGYQSPKGPKGTSKCVGGSWEAPVPKCQQVNSQGGKNVDQASPKVICTYASWEAHNGVNPENFNASLCDYVTYAFVGLSPNGKLRVQDKPLDVGQNKNGLYHKVTNMKQKNKNLKVLLSVGGSGASNASLFSSMAADPSKRSAFIESAKNFLQTYNFDGLDIEWHIPNVDDKANYIILLREVNQALKQNGWLVTATVRSDPESTGYDGSQMNEVLDWINVKTYDMYGDWSQYTGQNSALYPSSKEYDWEKNHLNVDAAAKNWLAAGISKMKLAPSIAFYGRSFTLQDVSQNGIHSPIEGAGPGKGGMLKYSEICEKYANWSRSWDQEQRNPYKYFEDKWIGYDDKESVWIKAAYIKENGYFGVNVWPVDGDDVHGKCGVKQILLKQVQNALASRTK
ncbi:uncharacterized protein LOC108909692 isoform X2 [Anoplophora glabripennis]|uniref:uncharacterized protein LOC108909692 isoform X2 n=1 Tax=Anoplophora glabripennis TaxID=217634 RepID=UPI000873C9EB|nr:uncharacterized protein LOC108909692 isoform X2 [Anoplophora glabripennis]